MSNRVSTSITLNADHKEWMDEENINRSSFINDLIDEYRKSEDRMDEVVRQYQIEQLSADIEADQSKLEAKQNRLEELKEDQQEQSAKETADLEKARDVLSDAERDPSNPAIENWAERLGMTATELVEELDNGDEQ